MRTVTAEAAPLVHSRARLRSPEPFDVVLVMGIGVIYVLVLPAAPIPRDEHLSVILFSALTLLPLLWRTSAPLMSWALVIAIQGAVFLAVENADVSGAGITYLAPLTGLGAVAARRPLWVSTLALATTYSFLVTAGVIAMAAGPYPDAIAWAFISSGALCAIAWGLGVFAHRHHRRLEQLHREHESAGQAVQAERSRIATELNGIVKDAVTSMMRDASAVRATTDHERIVAAFASIEAAGVEAMHELRRMLHVLHDQAEFTLSPPADAYDGAGTREEWWRKGLHRFARVTVWDAVITVFAITVTVLASMSVFFGTARMDASLYFVVVLCVLLWRRAFPVAVFLLVIVADAGAVFLFRNGDFGWDSYTAVAPVMITLATVAATRSPWVSIPVLAVAWGYLSVPQYSSPEYLATNLAAVTVLAIAVWLVGTLTGVRRRQISRLEIDRQVALQTAAEERARLAYDLHDLIGHSITTMVLQAAGARRIISHDFDRAMQTVPPIEAAGAAALTELDKLVRILLKDSAMIPPSQPVHRLTDVNELIDRAQHNLASATVTVNGEPTRLEPSVDLAAFIVVREALDNAAKHAGPNTRADVTVSWADDLVRVEICNTVSEDHDRPSADLSGGFGLVNLRERVKIAGGKLRWSRDEDFFQVEATFPAAGAT